MDLSSNSSTSNFDEFENKEETAQQWIFRHLIEFTSCEDNSAKNLVDGDCSPLIQLLTDMTQSKTLFITISKPTKNELPSAIVQPIVPLVPECASTKKTTKKKSKSKVSKNNRKKTKSTSKTKKNKLPKKKREKENTIIPEPVFPIVDPMVDMVFEWWTMTDLPPHEQFIFIIPKSGISNIETQLDQLYHIGYVKNRRLLKTALSCVDNVFHDKLSFAMKIDLFLLINEIEDSKMSKQFVFERFGKVMNVWRNTIRFILENISRNFNLNGRIRNIDTDARSITLILSQTIQSYCFQPDISERSRLLIQLSFYDIEYLGFFPDITITGSKNIPIRIEILTNIPASRLERALKHISFLHFLYKDSISEWTRKTYLYILDLFSTILAHEITKKSNFMTNYSPGSKIGPICRTFKKVVQKLVTVSKDVFETQEDWSATSKVSFSFYIVGILEEEIDSIIEKVEEMNSEVRDMSLDRSAIEATKIILTELDAYLQEKCLESAVESGNLESLRSLAATIVKHNKRMERVVALY